MTIEERAQLEKAQQSFDEAMKAIEQIANNSANMSLSDVIAEIAQIQCKHHKVILYLFGEVVRLKLKGE